jgi:hypothetical protein
LPQQQRRKGPSNKRASPPPLAIDSDEDDDGMHGGSMARAGEILRGLGRPPEQEKYCAATVTRKNNDLLLVTSPKKQKLSPINEAGGIDWFDKTGGKVLEDERGRSRAADRDLSIPEKTAPRSPASPSASPKSATMRGMFPRFFHAPPLSASSQPVSATAAPAAVLGSSVARGPVHTPLKRTSVPNTGAERDAGASPGAASTAANSPGSGSAGGMSSPGRHPMQHLEYMRMVDNVEGLQDFRRPSAGGNDGMLLIKESDGEPIFVSSFGRKYDGDEHCAHKYLVQIGCHFHSQLGAHFAHTSVEAAMASKGVGT